MDFNQVYNQNKGYVMTVCLKRCRNQAVAEEMSQEFFFWLSKNLNKFDPAKGTFKRWFNAHLIFKIQVYRHHLKFKGRGGLGELEFSSILLATELVCNRFNKEIDSAVTRASLLKAMDNLTEAQKRVMLLALNTDYTGSEIGRKLGISWNGVKFHQKNSYPVMRKALLKESYELE